MAPPYEIWFLEGDMSKEEREKVHRNLRPAFRDAFYHVADHHPFLKKNYVLRYRERCTEEFFVVRWMDGDTAGIFFVGHNRRGYPSLYHPSIDFKHVKEPAWQDWPVLDPKKLQEDVKGTNKNLCILVFVSCYSESLRAAWEAMLPKDAWFQGFPTIGSGLGWLRRLDKFGCAQIFRSLLYRGPAGPEPKKEKEFPWGLRCNIASAAQLRGPIGREVKARHVLPSKRGPLGFV